VFRKNANASQFELSEITGMSYSTISRIENDQRIPDLEQLFRYCYALGIPITEFLPPSIQHLGASEETQSLRSKYSQLTNANRELVLSTLGVLMDGLISQQRQNH
jgi:transcriptional regulator with XRE-family HTH domain